MRPKVRKSCPSSRRLQAKLDAQEARLKKLEGAVARLLPPVSLTHWLAVCTVTWTRSCSFSGSGWTGLSTPFSWMASTVRVIVATPGRNPNTHCSIPPVPPGRIGGCGQTLEKNRCRFREQSVSVHICKLGIWTKVRTGGVGGVRRHQVD